MTKHIVLLAALATSLAAAATPFSVGKKTLRPEKCENFVKSAVEFATSGSAIKAPAKAEAADDELYYTLAGDPRYAFGLQGQTAGNQIAQAFQFDPSFLASLEDVKITSISFYTGAHGDENVNTVKKATVFITDDLTAEEFLYSQDISDLPSTAFTKVDVALTQPFAVPEGKEIYVGVYCAVNDASCAPLVVDYLYHEEDYGGWYGVRQNSKQKWTWNNGAYDFGFVTVGATITAAQLPHNSVSVDAVAGQPVAYANDVFGFQFLVTNQGANNVEKITVEYGIEGEPTTTADMPVTGEWHFNQGIVAIVNEFVATKPTKASDIIVKVTAVNGEPNTCANPSHSYSVTIVPETSDLERNIVVEEFTSVGCQYCPVGYTTMEMLRENYQDGSIIPVCIHTNFGNTQDPMTSTSYSSVLNNFSEGTFPEAIINRLYNVYPDYETLMETAEEVLLLPAVARVDATATYDASTREVTVNTKSSFAFDYTDGDKNFILSFGITQDDMGPYQQLNGYAGREGEVLGDWNNKENKVSLIFNDVARQLSTFGGIKGSVPAEIAVGQTYDYTYKFKHLTNIDMAKAHVIVYLLNAKTKAIENACTVVAEAASSGIQSVAAESNNAPVEYYNLQGVRVSNPAEGLYIRRQGAETSKVIIK